MNSITTRNGVNIIDGQTVMYNGNTYVANYVGKDDIGWIGRPCGSTEGNDINLTEAINNNEIEIIE